MLFVLPDEIVFDSPFLISLQNEIPAALEESVRRHGIRTPVPVFRDSRGLVPLAGRKRLTAAKTVSPGKIPVTILSFENELQKWLFAVDEYLSHHSPGEMETAHILSHTYFAEESKDWSPLFRMMNIYPETNRLKIYRKTAALDENIKRYFSRYSFSFNQLETALSLDREILLYAVELADTLSIRPVEFLEIGNAFQSLCRRNGQPAENLAKETGIREIVNGQLNRNQKIQKIRAILKQAQYPNLSAVNQSIETLAAKLPKEIGVIWDKTLERDDLEVRLKLKEDEEFFSALDRLKTPEMRKIIEDIRKKLRSP